MKSTMLLKAVLPIALAELLIGTLAWLLVSPATALASVALVGGAVAIAAMVATDKPMVPHWPQVSLSLALGLVAVTSWVDHSAISGMVTATFATLGTYLVRYASRHLAPTNDLSPLVTTSLSRAGFTLSVDQVGGWHSAASPKGAVVLLREVRSEKGDPTTWASYRSLSSQISKSMSTFTSQGISPTAIVIASGATGISLPDNNPRLCSPDKLFGVLTSVSSSITNPVTLAKSQGIDIPRTQARAITRTQGKSKTKVVHQGRVTKKV